MKKEATFPWYEDEVYNNISFGVVRRTRQSFFPVRRSFIWQHQFRLCPSEQLPSSLDFLKRLDCRVQVGRRLGIQACPSHPYWTRVSIIFNYTVKHDINPVSSTRLYTPSHALIEVFEIPLQ